MHRHVQLLRAHIPSCAVLNPAALYLYFISDSVLYTFWGVIMTGRFTLVFCIAMIALLGPAPAKDNTCKPNGCGPDGALGMAVPNRTILTQCEFEAACNKHDLCYSRCEACGDLAGQGTCTNQTARELRRTGCDIALEADIDAINNKRTVCKVWSWLFYEFVSKGGRRLFHGRRLPIELSEPWAGQSRSLNALAEYVEKNPGKIDLDEFNRTMTGLSALQSKEPNFFKFALVEGEPKLSFGGKSSDVPLTIVGKRPTGELIARQRIINGVDVSGMVVDGKPFDLNAAFGGKPDFSTNKFIQMDKFQAVK